MAVPLRIRLHQQKEAPSRHLENRVTTSCVVFLTEPERCDHGHAESEETAEAGGRNSGRAAHNGQSAIRLRQRWVSKAPERSHEISCASGSSAALNGDGSVAGLKAEKIISASTDSNNRIKFLIKWKDTNEAELVLADIANHVIPEV